MDTELLKQESGNGRAANSARIKRLSLNPVGQQCPSDYPQRCPSPKVPRGTRPPFVARAPNPRPIAARAFPEQLHGKLKPLPRETKSLGPPLSLRQVATLIGLSPWSVRQTLIPQGLPFVRFAASGRLIFYQDQVVRWIEKQIQGG